MRPAGFFLTEVCGIFRRKPLDQPIQPAYLRLPMRATPALVPDPLMVRERTLTPSIKVRILVGHPNIRQSRKFKPYMNLAIAFSGRSLVFGGGIGLDD